jgi:hypothetical protein
MSIPNILPYTGNRLSSSMITAKNPRKLVIMRLIVERSSIRTGYLDLDSVVYPLHPDHTRITVQR